MVVIVTQNYAESNLSKMHLRLKQAQLYNKIYDD